MRQWLKAESGRGDGIVLRLKEIFKLSEVAFGDTEAVVGIAVVGRGIAWR